ncbi:hypothetical protein U1Q18_022189 [Sarracenia purpurea var. burkii]
MVDRFIRWRQPEINAGRYALRSFVYRSSMRRLEASPIIDLTNLAESLWGLVSRVDTSAQVELSRSEELKKTQGRGLHFKGTTTQIISRTLRSHQYVWVSAQLLCAGKTTIKSVSSLSRRLSSEETKVDGEVIVSH